MQPQSNYPLRKLNTFGMDVSARYFASAGSIGEIQELLLDSRFRGLDQVILGGGSNVLLSRDINGLVLKNDIRGIFKIREDERYAWVQAGAGEPWHPFVRHTIGLGLAGLENLSLIPGNTGAAPMQNIGAYGVELKDVFEELEALDRTDGSLVRFGVRDCEFGYRDSIFKGKFRDRFIIVTVTVRLSKIPEFHIEYGAITRELEAMGVSGLTIDGISQAVMRIRSSKLPDPALIGNAGSFFKNPECPASLVEALKDQYPEMPVYPAAEGKMKMAAGWLIEKAGWKGYRKGDAGVHPLQALVLVNYGHAKGEEILELAGRIQASVEEMFKISLEREVNVY